MKTTVEQYAGNLLTVAEHVLRNVPAGSEGFVPADPTREGYVYIAQPNRTWLPRTLIRIPPRQPENER